MTTIKATILQTFLFALIISTQDSSQASPTSPRPSPEDAPVFARWLVNQGSWGVLNTLDDKDGSPFGNVISYTDSGTGTPFFYLTEKLDPTGINAVKDSRSSFTLSEYVLGTCNWTTDPQAPICAKITLSGRLKVLDNNTKEAASAETALFAHHPQLAGWPKLHEFKVFKLDINKIFLVNLYAPKRTISVYDYFHPNM
ncbi:hypothetical protein Pfo_016170 [Paulownia fortunei]|nr:hypothetical protein Pfo_016170 [Paulownia fortunei]